jgi:cell division protein FtsQ
LREQVVTPRAGRASTDKGRSSGIVQRPARRERNSSSAASSSKSLRRVLAYVPIIGKVLLGVIAGVLIFAGYRAAASAAFFQVRAVDVSGTARASADDIKTVVRRGALQTGVWRADLAALSRELEELPWVRRATVSRVLPDALRVRVIERVPRAVVRTGAGKLMWVDEDAVMLDAMSPTDQMPAFFIHGWDEALTDAARAENRERIEKYLVMLKEWEAANLTERVSEVNLIDVRDVRAQLAGDDSQIEVRLGAIDFGKRLANALKVLDEQRNTPRGPFITRLDATFDKRVIVGFGSGNQTSVSENAGVDSTTTVTNGEAEVVKTKTNERSAERERRSERHKKEAEAERKQREERKKKKQEKKERSRDNGVDAEDAGTRPRRVG